MGVYRGCIYCFNSQEGAFGSIDRYQDIDGEQYCVNGKLRYGFRLDGIRSRYDWCNLMWTDAAILIEWVFETKATMQWRLHPHDFPHWQMLVFLIHRNGG